MGLGEIYCFYPEIISMIYTSNNIDSLSFAMTIFSFDFSINKPAATIWRSSNSSYFGNPVFMIWPISLTKKEKEIYNSLMYDSGPGFLYYCRDLDSISKDSNLTSSEMALEHTKRSVDLANRIILDLDALVGNDKEIYFVSEGLSLSSKGNSVLDLATYKGVLMSKIYERFPSVKIYTYSPMTIKSVAGCAKKDKAKDKHSMINAFMAEGNLEGNSFWEALKDGVLSYEVQKGKRKGETEYIHCVDDIVDSYFAMKTLSEKEGISLE